MAFVLIKVPTKWKLRLAPLLKPLVASFQARDGAGPGERLLGSGEGGRTVSMVEPAI